MRRRRRPVPGEDCAATRTQPGAPVVAVSTFAIAVGCSLGFLPGYLGPELVSNLGLSRGQLGLLISIFFGGTGIGSLVLAHFAFALGARLLIVADLGIVAASFLLIGLVNSYVLLIVAAVACGFGYAMTNIGSNLAVAAVTPVRSIALNMSIKTAGVPAMATAMAVAAPPIASRFSYQTVCLVMACAAAVVLVAAMVVLPAARENLDSRPTEGRLPVGFFWIPIAAFLVVAGSQPLLSWTVIYAQEVSTYSVAAIGISSGLGTGIGAVMLVLASLRSDNSGPSTRAKYIAIACILSFSGTMTVWFGTTQSIVLLAVGVFVGMSGTLVAAGMTHALVVDRAPHAVGRGSGLTMTGYYAGALLSPFLFGAIADGPGGYTAAWAISAGTLLVAVGCFTAIQRQSALRAIASA